MNSKMQLIEMMDSVVDFLNETIAAERKAMRYGISIQKTKDGKFVVLQSPRLGREVVKTTGGNVPSQLVNKFIAARGKVQEDADKGEPNYAPPVNNDYALHTPVQVIKSGLLRFAGVKQGVASIWTGDTGEIIGNNGNYLTILLKNSGRVEVSKDEFHNKFQIVDQDEVNSINNVHVGGN